MGLKRRSRCTRQKSASCQNMRIFCFSSAVLAHLLEVHYITAGLHSSVEVDQSPLYRNKNKVF